MHMLCVSRTERASDGWSAHRMRKGKFLRISTLLIFRYEKHLHCILILSIAIIFILHLTASEKIILIIKPNVKRC